MCVCMHTMSCQITSYEFVIRNKVAIHCILILMVRHGRPPHKRKPTRPNIRHRSNKLLINHYLLVNVSLKKRSLDPFPRCAYIFWFSSKTQSWSEAHLWGINNNRERERERTRVGKTTHTHTHTQTGQNNQATRHNIWLKHFYLFFCKVANT